MKRLAAVVCLVVALTAGTGSALAGGGNSVSAKKCQKGGWTSWVRDDRTPFANQGACVSYAAQGGVLTSPGGIGGAE